MKYSAGGDFCGTTGPQQWGTAPHRWTVARPIQQQGRPFSSPAAGLAQGNLERAGNDPFGVRLPSSMAKQDQRVDHLFALLPRQCAVAGDRVQRYNDQRPMLTVCQLNRDRAIEKLTE